MKRRGGAGQNDLAFVGEEGEGGVGATLHPYIYNMKIVTRAY